LNSCLNINYKRELKIPKEDIQNIWIEVPGRMIELKSVEKNILIEKLYTAECIGAVKGIVTNSFYINTLKNDTLSLRTLDNKVKWKNDGDFAYEIKDKNDFFINLRKTILRIDSIGNNKNKIKLLDSIFEEYKSNEESIESKENKEIVSFNLDQLNSKELNENDMFLLINYWIYYDPTDFDARQHIYRIFEERKLELKIFCQKRFDKRHQFEINNEYFKNCIEELKSKDWITFK
jgi:hypothetical protein